MRCTSKGEKELEYNALTRIIIARLQDIEESPSVRMGPFLFLHKICPKHTWNASMSFAPQNQNQQSAFIKRHTRSRHTRGCPSASHFQILGLVPNENSTSRTEWCNVFQPRERSVYVATIPYSSVSLKTSVYTWMETHHWWISNAYPIVLMPLQLWKLVSAFSGKELTYITQTRESARVWQWIFQQSMLYPCLQTVLKDFWRAFA